MYSGTETSFRNYLLEAKVILAVRLKRKQVDISMPGHCHGKKSDVGADIHDKSAGLRQSAGCSNEIPVDDALVHKVNATVRLAKNAALQIQMQGYEPIRRD
jgi:hypothetical protein